MGLKAQEALYLRIRLSGKKKKREAVFLPEKQKMRAGRLKCGIKPAVQIVNMKNIIGFCRFRLMLTVPLYLRCILHIWFWHLAADDGQENILSKMVKAADTA